MRIAIDLQTAQGSARNRGMGRYATALTQAIARRAGGEHDIILILNGAFPNTIDLIRQDFEGLVHPQNIRVWNGLAPTHAQDAANQWRRYASEELYTGFVKSLMPDFMLLLGLFEGLGDNFVASIPQINLNHAYAVVLYDLIPLINPDNYLGDQQRVAWYYNRLDHLRRANLLLAISESSRQESLNYLGSAPEDVINISTGYNKQFACNKYSRSKRMHICERYGLKRPFVMYVGAEDQRKNIEGLIAAYASLPVVLRQAHQLVVVFSVPEHTRKRLMELGRQMGLGSDELVLTGFIPDDDLVAIYNFCVLNVFPSWHEGFGLPALEAMACGAPTIASNRTSLPELIGWDEALFDPYDIASIAKAIERALTDQDFRDKLKLNGLQQAEKYSWDACAERALQAMETYHSARQTGAQQRPESVALQGRPKLAYISPLQSAQTGIADYSAELLPMLARYYAIDVIVEQSEQVTDPWVLGNATIRSATWFDLHAHQYDRILYQFGNSPFHSYMFGLLERHPGVVTLHDFFLSSVVYWMQETGYESGAAFDALNRSHGWLALREVILSDDVKDRIKNYPCNLNVLQRALGIITHSNYSQRLAETWYGLPLAAKWSLIPHLRAPVINARRDAARAALGLNDDTILVCSFGLLDNTKLNHKLIEAWRSSVLAHNPYCKLVFVGKLPGGEYGEHIQQLLKTAKDQISVTGWANEATYKYYLAAADLAVQLRTRSRGETSGTVLDCMNYGVPTIVNANGSMADLPAETVHHLPDEFTSTQLKQALELYYRQPGMRRALGERAAQHIRKHHKPNACATKYMEAIEQFYGQAENGTYGLIKAVQHLGLPSQPSDLVKFAERVAEIYPPVKPAIRQLFVDVSELAVRDARTGIHRVVRNVLQELLEHPPVGFRVEPVYATESRGYHYARRFTARFLDLGDVLLDDDPISAENGDVFWGLDWQPASVCLHRSAFNDMKLRGIKVVFTVYDILPITLPQTTFQSVSEAQYHWLEAITNIADGLLCISRSVGVELKQWLRLFGRQEGHPLHIGWAHLGANVLQYDKDKVVRRTSEQNAQLSAISRYPVFLLVGTLEPRKNQAQVLAAFELLWEKGEQVNLVIIGKQGWMVDDLAQYLRSHPMKDRHMFWLEGIADDMLESIYAASTCLIAASLDEGFGLPLIEAARYRLPILARDISVFREVAMHYAHYFTGVSPYDLAQDLRHWLNSHRQGLAPKSDDMPWMTWAQSAQAMLDIILNSKWQDQWQPAKDPGLVVRYWASDHRLSTQVGSREGRTMLSTGVSGYLLHGPYITLKPGSYMVELRGGVGFGGIGGARVDVCIDGGTTILADQFLQVPAGGRQEGELADLHFTLEQPCRGLEVRIWVGEHSDVRLDLVEIRNLDARTAGKAHASVVNRQIDMIAWSLSYWATHPRLHTQIGHKVRRNLHTTGKAGVLLYGPYAALPAGRYVATVHGVANPVEGLRGVWMDVAWNMGAEVVLRQPLHTTENAQAGELGRIEFELLAYTNDVEVRVYVEIESDLRLDGLILAELDETHSVDVIKASASSSETSQYANIPEVLEIVRQDVMSVTRGGQPTPEHQIAGGRHGRNSRNLRSTKEVYDR